MTTYSEGMEQILPDMQFFKKNVFSNIFDNSNFRIEIGAKSAALHKLFLTFEKKNYDYNFIEII